MAFGGVFMRWKSGGYLIALLKFNIFFLFNNQGVKDLSSFNGDASKQHLLCSLGTPVNIYLHGSK